MNSATPPPVIVTATSPATATDTAPVTPFLKKWFIPAVVIATLIVAGLVAWQMLRPKGPGKGFVSGNGRLEATEIDVAAKLAGRMQDILVSEGDFVTAGQTLAHMQVQTPEAQRDEARARQDQSITAVASAEAQVAARKRSAGCTGPYRATRERVRCRTAASFALGDSDPRRRFVGAGTRR